MLSGERLREPTKAHFDCNIDIFINQEDSHLFKVKLQEGTQHQSPMLFGYLHWYSYILSWYCRCKTGARIVGVCAHTAAVFWYLGYARYKFILTKIDCVYEISTPLLKTLLLFQKKLTLRKWGKHYWINVKENEMCTYYILYFVFRYYRRHIYVVESPP